MEASPWRRSGGLILCSVVILGLTSRPARAEDTKVLEELKARLEKLEKQNEELKQKHQQIGEVQSGPDKPKDAGGQNERVQSIIDDDMKSKEAKKKEEDTKKKEDEAKAKQKEEEGYTVGSDLKMSVRWNTANGVTFETPNKDFISHLGVRFQLDNVWWTQTPSLKPVTQLGDLQDGVFFRRVRPSWDGVAWEVMEWNVELA